MTPPEFFAKVSKVLRLPEGAIKGGESLQAIPSWDSLSAVQFIVLADQEFQVSVSGRQLLECRTVDDLARLVGVAK